MPQPLALPVAVSPSPYDRSMERTEHDPSDLEVNEPYFDPPRGVENDEGDEHSGDGGVREPVFEPGR